MPFEKLTHTKINKKTGQPLSKNSVIVYKNLLNRLADAGIDTKAKLIEESEFTIQLISDIYETQEKEDNEMKRRMYSAIFYALDQEPLAVQKPYYEAFQKCKSS